MKKIGLLLLLSLAIAAQAQQAASTPAEETAADGTLLTTTTFPFERVETPTATDMYCAGFISHDLLPNSNYVAGGLESPGTSKFVKGDVVFLTGSSYQPGQQFTVLRELVDPNKYELFAGQHSMLKAAGQPYYEVGRVQVLDARHKTAVARVNFSCDPVNPGDILVPFVEKPAIAFHPPARFDRMALANGKVGGRILMAKDFDGELANGAKVYLNVGGNQGVKIGDYFRAVRSYTADLKDPVDSLSFKASTSEDTQKKQPSIDPKLLTKTNGPTIHVSDFPRRAVGELVIIGTTPTTATGMIVFAMEDIHVGDAVELDEQQ
ncbi:MAG TPA: hypothetical protein VH079_13965 [Terriglobales bacterium]|nr:hypothetical protein [Terriglobales bacterium]